MAVHTNDISLFSFLVELRPLCLPNRHSPIRHPKVRSNRLLSANTTASLHLRTGGTIEDTNLQHTRNPLDSAGQSLDLPLSIFSVAVLARRDIGLGEKGLEGGVDDEEILVALQRPFLGGRAETDGGVDAAELLEFVQDPTRGDGGHLDRHIFPVGEETGLQLARVYGNIVNQCPSYSTKTQ